MREIDGFYSGLFSGKSGEGSAMFVLQNGVLTGADPLGVTFDGRYQPKPDGGFTGKVTVKVPPNGEVVQGVTSGPDGLTYDVEIDMPSDFTSRPYMALQTPLGPVNFSMKLIRSLG